MGGSVLILDTQRASCSVLAQALGYDGYRVDVVVDGHEAVERCSAYDVIVADVAASVVLRLKARAPSTEIVVLASADGLDDALVAVRQGAFDFVLEPFYADDISLTIACAAAHRHGRSFTSALTYVRRNVDLLR